MIVAAGSTDVTTYFVLRLAADGTELTGATITDMDLQYVRSGAAPAAKVDATALAATNSAHADNKAIEIDGTDQPGLYRVDWPDAAFAAGAREVILSVKYATAFTEHLRVELSPAVDAVALSGDATAADNAEKFFDGTGYAGTNNTIPTVTNVTNAPTDMAKESTLTAIKGDGWVDETLVTIQAAIPAAAPTTSEIVTAMEAGNGALDTILGEVDALISRTPAVGPGEAGGLPILDAEGNLIVDFTEIKGATWDADTDTLEDIRDAIPAAAPSADDIKTAIEAEGSHLALIKAATDNLPADPAGVSDLPSEPPSAADIADAVLDEPLGTHAGLIATNLDAKVSDAASATDVSSAQTAIINALPSEPPSATDIRTELEAEGTTLYAVAAAADALLVRTPNATAGEPTGLPVLNAEGDLAVTISEEQAEALALAIAETIEVPPADVDEAAIVAAILDAVLTAHVTPDSLAVVVKAINATLGGVFGTGTLLKTFTSKDNATGLALPGVLVTCWRDATLVTQNGGTQVSDAEGKTRWLCVEGETYYFVQQLSGYTFEVEEEVA